MTPAHVPASPPRRPPPPGAVHASWTWAVALGLLILAAPLWLWDDPLDRYSPPGRGLTGLFERHAALADPFGETLLKLDDFEYVARSRTAADLRRGLLTPHNTHLVPLFRAWTYLWVQAAGSLAGLPRMFGLAAYLAYLLVMLLVGHVAAWETGRAEVGLAAMAGFGVSAVLWTTASWFAASQALWGAAGVIAAVAAVQRWRATGRWGWLAAAAGAAAAAPLFWSGGYVAGPAAVAYLAADDGPRRERLGGAALLLGVTGLVAVAAGLVAGPRIATAENFHGRTVAQAVNPVQGLVSTAQGVVEVLVLRNLGVAAETSPAQAAVLGLLLAGVWAWTRGRPLRVNRLEAAGASAAVLGFALVYTARGYYGFENLRDLSWYQAIPEAGAALFAAGWWGGRGLASGPPPRWLSQPTRRGLLAALAVALAALVLQTPLVRAQRAAAGEARARAEGLVFRTPEFRRLWSRTSGSSRAEWQQRQLARLDRAGALARALGASRESIRRGLGPVDLSTMSDAPAGFDGGRLLPLPESGGRDDPARTAAVLAPELALDPEPPLKGVLRSEPIAPKSLP
jgi:hypothetical protein